MPSAGPAREFTTAVEATRVRFAALEARLDECGWRVFAALASETQLGKSVLEHFGAREDDLRSWQEEAWLVRAGDGRARSFLQSGPLEASYEVAAELRQLILRAAHKRGLLLAVTLKLEELLGARSKSSLVRKLQTGTLIFRPAEQHLVSPEVSAALRASLLEPFDPPWMVDTWGKRTASVVHHVLLTSMYAAEECSELLNWVNEQSDLRDDPSFHELLACQALHAQEHELFEMHARELPACTRLGLSAVLRLQTGESALARGLLEQSLTFSSSKYPPIHPFSPLLALLHATSGADGNSAAQVLKWSSGRIANDESKRAGRALKLLLRYRDESHAGLKRIDAHQVAADAPPFELLLLGLATLAYVEQPGARAAWSERLSRSATTWIERGYIWLGRQALVLACELDRTQMQRSLDETGRALPLSEVALLRQAGDLSALVAPPAPWEKGLAALDRLSSTMAENLRRYRLEWFVDPHSGTVNRPGLQRHESGRGWHLERRLSFSEAQALSDDLPPEDKQVLSCLAQWDENDPDLHLHVFEALINHPRVVDGTRGGASISVTRDECRVETTDEVAHLRIFVNPAGLGPGLNLVRESEARMNVIFVSPEMHQVIQTLPQDLLVPHSDAGRVLSVLGRLSDGITIKSPHLEGETTTQADATPALRIAPLAGAFIVELGVQPFGSEGRFFPMGTGPAILTSTRDGRRLRTSRNFDAEKRSVSQLVAQCPTLLQSMNEAEDGRNTERWVLGHERLLDLLVELRDATIPHHISWADGPGLRITSSLSIGALRGALRANKGWYIVSGSVALDQITALSLAELARLPVVSRGRFIRLPSGDYAPIERKLRQLISVFSAAKTQAGGAVQLSAVQLAYVRSILEGAQGDGAVIDLDEPTRAALLKQDQVQSLNLEVPQALHATLRPYQVDGYRWLCRLSELGFGACLADDMGLGKTVQVISFLLTRPLGSTHLVVCPSSVCTNWEREITRFAPDLSIETYESSGIGLPLKPSLDQSGSVRSRVFIVSYTQLSESCDELKKQVWDTVVVDEAQYIKNPKTRRAQAVIALSAQCRIALTGTPIENHLGDLWGIFRFLNPDLLGKWSAFQTHFVKPIERDKDTLMRECLARIVRPYLLRRLKSEVLKDLPERTVLRHEVSLNDEEALRYAYLRRQIHDKLRTRAGKMNNKLEVLAEITRLRRFCCHPRLIFPEAPDDSAKLRALIPLVQELSENQHRALVFSQYVDFLGKVRERLDEHGIGYQYLDGSTKRQQRTEQVDKFQNGDAPLFLISLKAGGIGLNLTAADYVIHLDPWWNPATLAQATDRAHRLGQTRPVTVYEFVTRDTIEEDIVQLHESKRDLADKLLENTEGAADLDNHEMVTWLLQSFDARHTTGL